MEPRHLRLGLCGLRVRCLNATTRTLSIAVELDDVTAARATGITLAASCIPPALINSFAKVAIEGNTPEDTCAVRSTALRNGDTLWLYVSIERSGGTL